VVIDVFVDVAILLPFDLLLGCDHGPALATAQRAAVREIEAAAARLRTRRIAYQRLNLPVLRLGDHRLVGAGVPVAAAHRILEAAVIEGPGEDIVDVAPAHLVSERGAEAPFLIGDGEDSGRGVAPGKHEVEHLTHELKALRVRHDGLVASFREFVVEIPQRCGSRVDALLGFGAKTAFDIDPLVVVLKLRLAAEEAKQELVIGRVAVGLGRGADFEKLLPVHQVYDDASVNGVAGDAIGTPGEQGVDVPTLDCRNELIEHRAPGPLGRVGLHVAFPHGKAIAADKRVEFACLRLDGRDLAVFLFGGFPRVDAEYISDSPAARALAERHETWAGELPQADELWDWLSGLGRKQQLELLAYCTARTINAVKCRRYRNDGDRLVQAETLGEAVSLDMSKWWQPTRASYFDRVTKQQIVEAVAEAVSPEAAENIVTMKKAAMVAKAEEMLSGTGWLPELLRADSTL